MPTIERAERVRQGMQKGTCRRYVIVIDTRWMCYRVLPESDPRVDYDYPRAA